MARARNIKPGFFKNENLVEMSFETRLLFIGLWCLADREGRFENRPKKIKMELFPCDDIDIDKCLKELESGGFLIQYESNGLRYAQIINFTKHQMPHHKEVASAIPAPNGYVQITKHPHDVPYDVRESVFKRDGMACLRCGTDDGLSIDHIIPLSLGGDNETSNLQTLCKSCNSSKGGSTKDYRNLNVGSMLDQRSSNEVTSFPTDSLIPDSLLLIPDSLIAESKAGGDSCESPTQPSPKNKMKSGSIGRRFTDQDELKPEWIAYCNDVRPDLDPKSVFEDFRCHWIAKAGADARKTNWDLTWQGWVRRQHNKPISTYDRKMKTLSDLTGGIHGSSSDAEFKPLVEPQIIDMEHSNANLLR